MLGAFDRDGYRVDDLADNFFGQATAKPRLRIDDQAMRQHIGGHLFDVIGNDEVTAVYRRTRLAGSI